MIVSELVKEVLGPRYGPEETLSYESTPLIEYITGILAPRDTSIDKEEEFENLIGDVSEGEEGLSEESVTFSPILNPIKQPSAVGLSFILKTVENDDPSLSICVTWGKYSRITKQVDEKNVTVWQRKPYYMIINDLGVKSGNSFNIYPHQATYSNTKEVIVTLKIFSKTIAPNVTFFNVFFCNEELESSYEKGSYHVGELHVFQPQIRIKLGNNTELHPIQNFKPLYKADREDQILDLIYRKNPVMVRGYMCAGIWERFDPESSSKPEEYKNRPKSPPFYWVDGETIPNNLGNEFITPHLRTEFVPLYNITMPSLTWDEKYGHQPVLDAGELAESWDTNKIEASLIPLTEGYEKWIKDCRNQLPNIPKAQRAIGELNVTRHQIVLRRLNHAIDVLKTDDEARLSFCFLNKAIDLQYRWRQRIQERPEIGLTWRPFQLAFILINIPSITGVEKEDICDLLWVPTGTGKTEAYLGIAAFTLAYRRRKSLTNSSMLNGALGTTIISRYTLRLLTIQQYRRALRLITACEYLRTLGLPSDSIGWRPTNCKNDDHFIWGSSRFSIGLWVGGEMTPNSLQSTISYNRRQRRSVKFLGAIDILKGEGYGRGDPAQIIHCPCCDALLSIPDNLGKGTYTTHTIISTEKEISKQSFVFPSIDKIIEIKNAKASYLGVSNQRHQYTITTDIDIATTIDARKYDEWWSNSIQPTIEKSVNGASINVECARPSRMGYYLKELEEDVFIDFEIYCNNPKCDLNNHYWCEGGPCGYIDSSIPEAPDFKRWLPVNDIFLVNSTKSVSKRMPIPAYTVDDQIYHRCPSIIVSTVDKFARMPFEPKSAGIFGNVNRFHRLYGYYRKMMPPKDPFSQRGNPRQPIEDPRPSGSNFIIEVEPFQPPDLIIQDELHLIEGPLGSLVGIYETAIDALSTNINHKVKYIASTATIRKATEQVQSVFLRQLAIFPNPSLDAQDLFFLRSQSTHPLSPEAGRLHIGICAPGKGAQTPIVRLWAVLLQYMYSELQADNYSKEEIDPYWTVVGYFNAIRELAGAEALYKQDVVGRFSDPSMTQRFGTPRQPADHTELSSRIKSTELPIYLDVLEKKALSSDPPDEVPLAIFTTNIFGVGVDIPRLGLMIVHGQPKTTSSYIQATGRIGRRNPGIVITFYKATRPRDLSHYEYFVGYHSMLNRFVEPITVYPFAPRVFERAGGPVMVSIMRCATNVDETPVGGTWAIEQKLVRNNYFSGAQLMESGRQDPEIIILPKILTRRGENQPQLRKPDLDDLDTNLKSGLDQWHNYAVTSSDRNSTIIYWERRAPGARSNYITVLGDPTSTSNTMESVFENTPYSLRDIEETIGLEVPRRD